MAKKYNLSPQQDMAANPNENVWVQANAGTGKTSVLVQRLLRILFRSFDTDFEKSGILCLTYTNAGAAEMRNRILAELSKWAIASDDELSDLLSNISINPQITNADLSKARKIFFNYIDNPQILKIKTIHGFCEEILHRFPTESGVSPAWKLISDSNQKILLNDAFDNLITYSKDPVVHNAFAHIVSRIPETKFDSLLTILTGQYRQFFQVNNISSYRKYFIDITRKYLELNLQTNDEKSVANLENIVNLTEQDVNSSKKPAGYLIKIINYTKQYIDNTINFEKYKTAYLTAEDAKIVNVAKKDYLVDEQDRVYEINQYNLNKQTFDDTIALFDLSAAFAQNYQNLKQKCNLLDFDDLILYTRKLFSSPDSMGWVLSQLDLQISHILVDEAQDTSPEQWDIMKMLAGDFFTDGCTKTNSRSLFVVGDTKQSIYGFQGADPNAFAESRDKITQTIQQNMRTINEIPLTQSFRSARAILKTVDTIFSNKSIYDLTGFINNAHACFRDDANGLVELHPYITSKTEATDKDAEKISANMARREYIKSIATKIQSLILNENISANDIMVLVQRRNPFASPLVKELKSMGIEVAGNDRIILPEFPAIRDLLNLVRFCIDSTDDYSLCCTLKSPFYRLTERDIFGLCKLRKGQKIGDKKPSVFDILQIQIPEIHSQLTEIIEWSKTLAPYSFFTSFLNTNNMRQNVISALGTQIIDPLEEFLTICLSYERTQTGTLKHFLKWFITSGSEIKRDMDASSGVRIVTVHGSKGLEAPVIFLIDTVRTPADKKENVITLNSNGAELNEFSKFTPWLWLPKTLTGSENIIRASSAAMQKQFAEYYRLLYVAMTRARDRLYIYGFGTNKNPPENAWHTKLSEILSDGADIQHHNNIIRICND